jgi:hypothetical protein
MSAKVLSANNCRKTRQLMHPNLDHRVYTAVNHLSRQRKRVLVGVRLALGLHVLAMLKIEEEIRKESSKLFKPCS